MTGIVCEGGGMRGIFTAGVLQAFMDHHFDADLLVGVSAGASNGVSYVSGQNQRGLRTNLEYVGDKRYLSIGSFITTGSLFGMDFIFGEIPEKLDPFDFDAFHSSKCLYFAGTTNVKTGQAVFFGKQAIQPGLQVLRASCSIPILSPIVDINGHGYLDGGISAPIPIDKALEEGCTRLLVILTRPIGYQKKAQNFRSIYHYKYRKYPNLVRALDLRHLVYNHTLERVHRLEQEGKAIVVAPPEPLPVDRFGQDREKLLAGYSLGLEAGTKAINLI